MEGPQQENSSAKIEKLPQFVEQVAIPLIGMWVDKTLREVHKRGPENNLILCYMRDAYPFYRMARQYSEDYGIEKKILFSYIFLVRSGIIRY